MTIDHDAHLRRLEHLKTTLPMQVGSQGSMVGWLLNMHGQHPTTAIGLRIIFSKAPSLRLGGRTHADATPLAWPTETDFAVAVGFCNGASLM